MSQRDDARVSLDLKFGHLFAEFPTDWSAYEIDLLVQNEGGGYQTSDSSELFKSG